MTKLLSLSLKGIRGCVKGLAFSLALLIVGFAAHAQSKDQLERQRKAKERQIAQTQKMIDQTRRDQRNTLEFLKLIDAKIADRQSVMGSLNIELNLINKNIASMSNEAMGLQNTLDALKAEYGKYLRYAYKNRGQENLLIYVFAAGSLNEAWQRLKFIQFYATYRNRQILAINENQTALAERIIELKGHQQEKKEIANELTLEKRKLENDKFEKRELADKLKSKEKDLRKELQNRRAEAASLNRKIQAVIAKELAASKLKEKSSGKSTKGSSGLAMTPEVSALGKSFASNRRNLPWPVERGTIVEHFGDHPHATLDHVTVTSNGIRIRTGQNAQIRAIYEGEVRAVIPMSRGLYAVLIRHGNYFTMYNGLADVTVKVGDKVQSKVAIGVAGENKKSGGYEVELQIWQNETKLDPEGWLKQ